MDIEKLKVNCPVCGMKVKVNEGDEGTNFYEPDLPTKSEIRAMLPPNYLYGQEIAEIIYRRIHDKN